MYTGTVYPFWSKQKLFCELNALKSEPNLNSRNDLCERVLLSPETIDEN
jgi:hypothetical protein